MKAGIYIHVPVCLTKCDYCAFYSESLASLADADAALDIFLDQLIREIDTRAEKYPGITADTLYFGGGTPSLLGPERIYRIVKHIEKTFTLSSGDEITLEVNPVHSGQLAEYRDSGINRVVLGVQTLDKKIHSIIGRKPPMPSQEMLDGFFGVEGITHCVDMITGIPGQTPEGYGDELKKIIAYRPEHISVYTLSIEEGTGLSRRMKPDDSFQEHQGRMFEENLSLLGAAGYEHYEISNFCLKGCESRHNLKYWRFEPYLGFGPSAHSFTGDKRFGNSMSFGDYLWADKFQYQSDERSPEDSMVEYIMTGLRLRSGFSVAEMEHRLNFRVPTDVMKAIRKVSDDGYLCFSEDDNLRIRLTLDGILVADWVIYTVVESVLNRQVI